MYDKEKNIYPHEKKRRACVMGIRNGVHRSSTAIDLATRSYRGVSDTEV